MAGFTLGQPIWEQQRPQFIINFIGIGAGAGALGQMPKSVDCNCLSSLLWMDSDQACRRDGKERKSRAERE
jgi:hypothetical protein